MQNRSVPLNGAPPFLLTVGYHLSKKMKEKFFYIEYEIGNEERHNKFEILFLKLREEKENYYQSGIEPSSEAEDWIKYLDDEARKWFNKIVLKPNSHQLKIYNE